MKNIIFDFGNVLVQWHPERVYNEYFGDEAKTWWFLRHICDAGWRNRIDAGESQDACIRQLSAQQPDYADAIELYRSRWREMLTGEVPGMRAVVENAKAVGFGIYGLTNWSMETFPEARRRFGILQLIDDYVVSGAEGLVKPDPGLFKVLLDRFGLDAHDCIFVDDNPDNVQAAEKLGMEAIVFRDAADLRTRLGLDLMLARHLFRNDRFATELTGAEIIHVGPHTATCQLTLDGKHLNARGSAMGGVLFTLADFASAVAANSECLADGDLRWVSLDATVHYLAPAAGTLRATAVPLKTGRTTALYQTTLSASDSDKPVAIVTTTLLHTRPSDNTTPQECTPPPIQ